MEFIIFIICVMTIEHSYNPSHKKRKDSRETRAVVQNFNNKLEFPRVVFNYMQGFFDIKT